MYKLHEENYNCKIIAWNRDGRFPQKKWKKDVFSKNCDFNLDVFKHRLPFQTNTKMSKNCLYRNFFMNKNCEGDSF